MPASYATEAELTAWLPDDAEVTDGDRLLERASELLDGTITAPFNVDTETELPTDDTAAAAMRDACCAQVEFWLEVGEEHDVTGLTGAVSVGHLRLDRLPPRLAPRAKRILGTAGLFADGTNWVWP